METPKTSDVTFFFLIFNSIKLDWPAKAAQLEARLRAAVGALNAS